MTAHQIPETPGQDSDATYPMELFYNVHRWYEPQTGRYASVDPLGLRDGPNPMIYGLARPTTTIDPLGLAVLVCTRKTTFLVGNHAYFWDDRGGLRLEERFCGRGNSPVESGPDGPGTGLPPGTGDECNVVPGSPGREDDLMGCCRREKTHGHDFYFPGIRDCHSTIRDRGALRAGACRG